MSWDIAAAGTLILDDITTPHGWRPRLLGGSAVYFTLAARELAHVHTHGRVGNDARAEFLQLLEHDNVSTEGVQSTEQATRKWTATQDFTRWVAIVEGEHGGSDASWNDDWNHRLTPQAKRAAVLFVGSMAPDYQLDIIEQSQAQLVACDFMIHFINDERPTVQKVLAKSDVLFVNHEELAALAQADLGDWRESAQRLIADNPRLRAVVVKAGPRGAALVTADSITEREAEPVSDVIDPTGAGDSVAGGFLGYCAQVGGDDPQTFQNALDQGLKTAARAISSFGTDALRGVAGHEPTTPPPGKAQAKSVG